jgi:hypothetical protein
MISPGGLLLVVPHLFAVPVSVFMRGVENKYITKLGFEKYLAGSSSSSHTEHRWRCSNMLHNSCCHDVSNPSLLHKRMKNLEYFL